MTPMTSNRVMMVFRMVVMVFRMVVMVFRMVVMTRSIVMTCSIMILRITTAPTPPLNTPRHPYLPSSLDSRISSSIASSESLSYGIVRPRSSRPAIRSIVRTSSKHTSRRPSAR